MNEPYGSIERSEKKERERNRVDLMCGHEKEKAERAREKIFDAVAESLRIENVEREREREKNECAARHFISTDVPYRASSCMGKNRTRMLFDQAQRWTNRW